MPYGTREQMHTLARAVRQHLTQIVNASSVSRNPK